MIGVPRHRSTSFRKALSVRVSHRFTADSARFDEENLVSYAGLVALLGLAEQTRLPRIIAEKVSIKTPRIKSGSANPVPKLLGVVAGMCAGADSARTWRCCARAGCRSCSTRSTRPRRWARCCGSSPMERKRSLLDTGSLAGRSLRGDRDRDRGRVLRCLSVVDAEVVGVGLWSRGTRRRSSTFQP